MLEFTQPSVDEQRSFTQPSQQDEHKLDIDLTYWKNVLSDASEALDLPTDHARSVVSSKHRSRLSFVLSHELSEALIKLSRREGVTLYSCLLASFQTLLYRYSGQSDLLIGSPITFYDAQQSHLHTFLNTLVLRTSLANNPTVYELLERVHTVVTQAHAHHTVPLDTLVQHVQPALTAQSDPLVRVMFALEGPRPALPYGWTSSRVDAGAASLDYELALTIEDKLAELSGYFEYSSELFEEATIRRMLDQWQTLLTSFVHDPSQQIDRVPLLSEGERRQILVEWNATRSSYPVDRCVHQLFEEQVERTPEKIAMVFGEQALTYRELNQRANQLARYLRRRGVGPEVLVGLCLQRSPDMLVALLGVLKAGGAYVPLDPNYPSDRLAYMVQDSQPLLLLTQDELLARLPQDASEMVCLDRAWSAISQEDTQNIASEVGAENRMYVIYTSGSTGRPKGVQILHRAVVNFLFSMQRDLHVTEQDSLLAVTTLSFDIAVLELFLPLVTGARLLLERPEVTSDGLQLAEKVRSSRPTLMQATPATWRMLLDAGLPEQPQLQILCGGEALSQELREQLLAKKPAALWNLYGPTETTIWSTACQVVITNEPISIGRPIANTQIYLLDAQMQPVPVGVAGELYIGGAGLARGYLNQPTITAEKFVAHPLSMEPGARLYRTGDLARYRSDGRIEFLGRIDHQVKIRGFRIELGEIETVLKQHPAMRQAVVVAREDSSASKILVAYLVATEGQQLTLNELLDFLRAKLPAYMIPSKFVLLDALPLTPNGKIDRRALPAPESSRSMLAATVAAPLSPEHQQLLTIWEELLQTGPIGIKDNFFLLGGHSLLAVSLIDRIEKVFHKRLTLSTLLERPTIEQLADVLQNGSGSRSLITTIQGQGTKRPFFFLHGDYNNGAFYCYPLAQQLGSDQPFYALEPYTVDDLHSMPTFEAIVQAQIELIRSVQPHGPYRLGGFCDGGLTAYEMARQLRLQGERVDLLVLIDSAYPPLLHRWTRSALDHVSALFRITPEKQLAWFLRLRHIYKYLRHQRRPEDFKDLTIDADICTLTPTLATLRQENIPMFEWIIAKYGFRAYPGKVTLFRCLDEPFDAVWRQKVAHEQNFELCTIPGTHESCRTEHLPALAEKLKSSLQRVQG